MKNILYLCLLMGYLPPINAANLQSPDSIQTAVRHYIAKTLPTDTEYQLKLNPIDHRLKLSLCTQPLHIFTHNRPLKAGRNSLAIQCNHQKKWLIYNTVILNIYKQVITLSQPIRRGELFNADILSYEKKEVSKLRSGFITHKADIINKQATRHLSIGTVITQANITEPKLIKKGDHITITAQLPNLEISVAGVAMMDGKKNQIIRVKNLKTQQVIQATVIEKGHVTITL